MTRTRKCLQALRNKIVLLVILYSFKQDLRIPPSANSSVTHSFPNEKVGHAMCTQSDQISQQILLTGLSSLMASLQASELDYIVKPILSIFFVEVSSQWRIKAGSFPHRGMDLTIWNMTSLSHLHGKKLRHRSF